MMLEAQIVGILAFLMVILASFSSSKQKIVVTHLIANVFYSLHYFLLGAVSGGSVCLVVVVSDFLLKNDKSKKELKKHSFIFTFLFLLVGIITGTNILSLIPVITAIFTMYLLFKEDANEVRLGMVFVSLMWLLYGFIIKSYVICITEFILAISSMIAYNKYKKRTG